MRASTVGGLDGPANDVPAVEGCHSGTNVVVTVSTEFPFPLLLFCFSRSRRRALAAFARVSALITHVAVN